MPYLTFVEKYVAPLTLCLTFVEKYVAPLVLSVTFVNTHVALLALASTFLIYGRCVKTALATAWQPALVQVVQHFSALTLHARARRHFVAPTH